MKKPKSEWELAGKLLKRDMSLKGNGPIANLQSKLVSLYPEGSSISQFACSPATNIYFEGQLLKLVLKEYPYLDRNSRKVASTVGMAMLQYSPVTLEGIEDFTIYKRS